MRRRANLRVGLSGAEQLLKRIARGFVGMFFRTLIPVQIPLQRYHIPWAVLMGGKGIREANGTIKVAQPAILCHVSLLLRSYFRQLLQKYLT